MIMNFSLSPRLKSCEKTSSCPNLAGQSGVYILHDALDQGDKLQAFQSKNVLG
jgi:hypothetical protein